VKTKVRVFALYSHYIRWPLSLVQKVLNCTYQTWSSEVERQVRLLMLLDLNYDAARMDRATFIDVSEIGLVRAGFWADEGLMRCNPGKGRPYAHNLGEALYAKYMGRLVDAGVELKTARFLAADLFPERGDQVQSAEIAELLRCVFAGQAPPRLLVAVANGTQTIFEYQLPTVDSSAVVLNLGKMVAEVVSAVRAIRAGRPIQSDTSTLNDEEDL
jgi:hypothetical protein